jgi:hypothetical protein
VLNLAKELPVPDRLSVSHHERISRAIMHPVLDWICKHSFIVTVVVTLIAVILCVVILQGLEVSEPPKGNDGVLIELSPRQLQVLPLEAREQIPLVSPNPVDPVEQPPLQPGAK